MKVNHRFTYSLFLMVFALNSTCYLYGGEESLEVKSKEKVAKIKWHIENVAEIRAYRTGWDDKYNRHTILDDDGKLIENRLPKEGVVLNTKQIASLHKAVTGSHKDHPVAACFNPHHAFVFFDKDGKILGSIDLCFMCSNYTHDPRGLAEVWDLDGLQKLLKDLKMPISNRDWGKKGN